MKLETKRLWLRPVSPDDKEALFSYRRDKEINQYQGWIPETMADVETFIGKIETQLNVPDSWFQLVLVEKESQQIIGDIGIHFLEAESRQAELGCTLALNFQRKGYASEALKRVIDFLFRELNKHRITTSIDPANHSSIRLVERIGFRKEAHFRESLWINGQWVDDLVFALLEKDWLTLNDN